MGFLFTFALVLIGLGHGISTRLPNTAKDSNIITFEEGVIGLGASGVIRVANVNGKRFASKSIRRQLDVNLLHSEFIASLLLTKDMLCVETVGVGTKHADGDYHFTPTNQVTISKNLRVRSPVFTELLSELCSSQLGDKNGVSTLTEVMSNVDILREFSNLVLGLKAMHSQQVYHGDIKPQNIYICSKGLKFGDFGTLRHSQIPVELTIHLLGTPGWSKCALLPREGDNAQTMTVHLAALDIHSLVLSIIATFSQTLVLDIQRLGRSFRGDALAAHVTDTTSCGNIQGLRTSSNLIGVSVFGRSTAYTMFCEGLKQLAKSFVGRMRVGDVVEGMHDQFNNIHSMYDDLNHQLLSLASAFELNEVHK